MLLLPSAADGQGTAVTHALTSGTCPLNPGAVPPQPPPPQSSTCATPKSLYSGRWRLAPGRAGPCPVSFCALLCRNPSPVWKEGGRGAFFCPSRFLLSRPLTHGSSRAVRNRTHQYPKRFFMHLLAYSKRLPAASSPRASGRSEPCCWCSNTFLPLGLLRVCVLNVITQTLLLILSMKRPLPVLLVRSV